ncbi:FAD-dependent oxidoreductase [Planococcus beigongshangi]|uniref:FAD-dependent oxidoreductase n=1 Tax=Planococcus beigongshangi TaxID=2782536 RepID=UPI00193BF946
MEFELVIIGGGPAGLMAALTAAEKGVKTAIVEESFALGGQLRQQAQVLENLPKEFGKQSGIALAKFFSNKVSSIGVTALLGHTMIGTYRNGTIGVSNGKDTFPIYAKKILVTTGAAEQAALFPGWTLPGVMTIGAAQILLNRERVLPGKEAVVLGCNSISYDIAKQLRACGVNVQGIIEKKSIDEIDKELIEKFESENIEVFFHSNIEKAAGKQHVEKVWIDNDVLKKEREIDLVCISNGLYPVTEPLELLDCEFTYIENLGGRIPKYGSSFTTSNSSVYVAGNAAGITCIEGILVTASIAVTGILEDLAILNNIEAKKQKEILWTELLKAETGRYSKVHDARISLVNDFLPKEI